MVKAKTLATKIQMTKIAFAGGEAIADSDDATLGEPSARVDGIRARADVAGQLP